MRLNTSARRIEALGLMRDGSETSVISLTKCGFNSKWNVSGSCTLTGDIEEAKEMRDCINAAFDELDKVTG